MAKHRLFPEFPERLFFFSKEAEDRLQYEQHVWREEELLSLQQEQTDWLKERERQNQIQKEIDRKSDRRFLWAVTLISAIVGAVIGSVVTIIYEAFFK